MAHFSSQYLPQIFRLGAALVFPVRCLCLALGLTTLAAALQIDLPVQRLPILVVSGANNHDWEWTHRSLVEILEQSELFEVTVTLDPAKDLADAELLAKFRAVVLDYNGPPWGTAAEEAFVQAVDMGLGVTVVHAANNAFPGWDAYESIVGHLWREGSSHGPFHAFDVDFTDRSHPIGAQFPNLRAHPDELYHALVNPQGVTRQVLAEAYSDPETGGSGQREPMVIVGRYGAGRVFHTPLGHVWKGNNASQASHLDPQFRQLIVRGTEWAACGHVSDYDPDAGVVPAELAHLGWRSLFDGLSAEGWRHEAGNGLPNGDWSVIDRCLVLAAEDAAEEDQSTSARDIRTTEAYTNFELTLEFLHNGQTNSERLPAEQTEDPAPGDRVVNLRAAGRWNQARILRRGDILEHWLNGRLCVRADTTSEDWTAIIASSELHRFVDIDPAGAGHISLRAAGEEVWFRNLFVRPFDSIEQRALDLFDGESLSGWTAHGDALYSASDGELVGRIGGGGQSFLVSDATFADFVFELELRNEDAGNSGLQFRSHLNEKGRMYGYQMEFDPSERAWSGGLYDEHRRGWLQNLEENPAGRAALRLGQWNTYRIEALGPWLRAWVNGIPTMNFLDPVDSAGQLGLQVHSGNNTHMRWRNLRMTEIQTNKKAQSPPPWNGPPGDSACPLGVATPHAHLFNDSPVHGTGILTITPRADATRIGIARTLAAGQVGMVSGSPGFRFLTQITAGGLVIDETMAFSVINLGEQSARQVSACFLDSRIALHRDGQLLLDSRTPPSRWGGSLQLFQCIDSSRESPKEAQVKDSSRRDVVWRGY